MNMTKEIGINIALIIKEFILPISWLGIFSISMTREFLNSLFNVHRSKTMVRKIKSKYSRLEKMMLKYAYVEPMHAKTISKFGVIYYWVNICWILLVYIIGIVAIVEGDLGAHFRTLLSLQFYCFNIPTIFFYCVLKVNPFSRSCLKWKFEKYHTSKEFDKLW